MFSKFQNDLRVPELNDVEPSITPSEKNIENGQDNIFTIRPEQRKDLIVDLLAQHKPLIWVTLEGGDHDPGRFWLKFLAALRKVIPDAGEELLAGLVDHHTQPLMNNVIKVLEVVHQNKFSVVLEKINFIQSTTWWESTLHELLKRGLPFDWLGINYQWSENEILNHLTEETVCELLIWDVLWHEWLGKVGLQFKLEEIKLLSEYGILSFENEKFSIPIVGWYTASQSAQYTIDAKQIDSHLTQLKEWLLLKEEWLEAIRVSIFLKEFEQAGDILEKYAESWLEEGFDGLEMLFWIREIPSVLLEARPQLCWVAAKACQDLNLKFLQSYYINHAENTLYSFSRFSRNQDHWMQIELNETGLKVGHLMEQLNKLKD